MPPQDDAARYEAAGKRWSREVCPRGLLRPVGPATPFEPNAGPGMKPTKVDVFESHRAVGRTQRPTRRSRRRPGMADAPNARQQPRDRGAKSRTPEAVLLAGLAGRTGQLALEA